MNYVLPYCGTCNCNGAKLAVAAVARAPPLFIKSFKVISCPTFIHSFLVASRSRRLNILFSSFFLSVTLFTKFMLFYVQDVLIDSFGHNYCAQVSWEHAQTCDMLRSGLMKLDLG